MICMCTIAYNDCIFLVISLISSDSFAKIPEIYFFIKKKLLEKKILLVRVHAIQ